MITIIFTSMGIREMTLKYSACKMYVHLRHDRTWELTYLVFLAAKALEIAPGCLIHRIGITHVSSRLVILFRGYGILVYAPAIPEAIRQLEDRKSQFTFGSSSFLYSRLKGKCFNIRTIRCCVRQVGDCASFVLWNTPTVPGDF